MTDRIELQNASDQAKMQELARKGTTGPWQGEPDEVLWFSSGLPCVIRRGPGLAWCGYVGVMKSAYRSISNLEEKMNVHGGVNYASVWGEKLKVALPDVNWPETMWVGFDCAHCDDLVPRHVDPLDPQANEVYRDKDYAISETENLAAQLADEIGALRLKAEYKVLETVRFRENDLVELRLEVSFREAGKLLRPDSKLLQRHRLIEALERMVDELRNDPNFGVGE